MTTLTRCPMRRSAGVSSAGSGVRRGRMAHDRCGRVVSSLELLYDLVYVVVIAQAAHHLAGTCWIRRRRRVRDRLRDDLGRLGQRLPVSRPHGREDGRTRNVVFIQMGILALLAVFTADAADGTARPSRSCTPRSSPCSPGCGTRCGVRIVTPPRVHDRHKGYAVGMVVAMVVVLASAFLPTGRATGGLGVSLRRVARRDRARLGSVTGDRAGLAPTDSLVERLGLFTIIVLGEVVFGVVDGLSCAEREVKTITTGMIALAVGLRLLVDLLRPRRPAPAAPRRRRRWPTGCSATCRSPCPSPRPAQRWSAYRPRRRRPHACRDRMAAVGRRGAGPAGPDHHRPIPR